MEEVHSYCDSACCRRCENLHQMQKEKELCDLSIRVLGTTIHVHRFVMAAGSQYFRSLFNSGMKECSSSVVDLDCCSAEVMEKIVAYIYVGEINLGNGDVIEILKASEYLLLSALKALCEHHIVKNIKSHDEFSLMQLAEEYSLPKLHKAAKRILLANFTPMSQRRPDFPTLSLANLKDIVGDDDVRATDLDLLDAVLVWTRHDSDWRVAFLPELLKLVRWGNIDNEVMVGKMRSEPLLQLPECKDVMMQVLQTVVSPLLASDEMSQILQTRRGAPQEVIMIIPKKNLPWFSILAYFINEDKWCLTTLGVSSVYSDQRKCQDLQAAQPRNSILCMNLEESTFSFHECCRGNWLKLCDCLENEGMIHVTPPMTDFDSDLKLNEDCMFVVVKDHLYVTGLGHCYLEMISTRMYFIDLLTGGHNQWQGTSPMPYGCELLEMMVHEGDTSTVFVFGICNDKNNGMDDMYMLQCYDVENSLWTAFTVAQCMEEDVYDYQLYFKGDVLHSKGIQQPFQDLIVITKNILLKCWACLGIGCNYGYRFCKTLNVQFTCTHKYLLVHYLKALFEQANDFITVRGDWTLQFILMYINEKMRLLSFIYSGTPLLLTHSGLTSVHYRGVSIIEGLL